MSIYLGNNQIRQVYLGDKKVSKMYLGSQLIYSGQNLVYTFVPETGELNREVFVSNAKTISSDGIVSIPEYVEMISSDNKPIMCAVVGVGINPNTLVGAFTYDNRVKEVILSDNIRFIDALSFHGCNNLLKINIPRTVTEIGGNISNPNSDLRGAAFGACKMLKSVIFENTSGWRIKEGTSYSSISSSDLENPAIAATYLNVVYQNNYWIHN